MLIFIAGRRIKLRDRNLTITRHLSFYKTLFSKGSSLVHSPFFYQNILNIQITTKQIADSNLTTKIKARGDNSTLELMHQTGVKGLAEGLRPSHPPLLQ